MGEGGAAQWRPSLWGPAWDNQQWWRGRGPVSGSWTHPSIKARSARRGRRRWRWRGHHPCWGGRDGRERRLRNDSGGDCSTHRRVVVGGETARRSSDKWVKLVKPRWLHVGVFPTPTPHPAPPNLRGLVLLLTVYEMLVNILLIANQCQSKSS